MKSELAERCADHYMPLLSTFCKKLTENQRPAEDFRGIPHPFIPVWGTRYEQAIVKMAFIGRDTNGWDPDLPDDDYIRKVQKWESSFDIKEDFPDFLRFQNLKVFQDLYYVGWSGNRYTFWGFVMYFLAALYHIKEDWVILKQRKHANILNSFLWGNVSAIETEESPNIKKAKPNPDAYRIAGKAADESNLNDFQHLQKIFSPDVSIIMCGQPDLCEKFLRNTTGKDLLWCKGKEFNGKELKVSLWKTGESFIFNMPHPMNLWRGGTEKAQQNFVQKQFEMVFWNMVFFIACWNLSTATRELKA